MTESLGEYNTEQLDRARVHSVSGDASDYIDELEQKNDTLCRQLEAVDIALDEAKYPRRHQGTNDYPHRLDRIGRIHEVMQYLQNEQDYWQVTYDRCSVLEAENEHLTQWINDLQSGTYVTCVYCGHNYGPDDEVPTSMANVLKEHIENCPKHPMSALKKELEHWKQAARENMDAAANIAGVIDEMYELQPCGHERRFIVTGKDSDIDPRGESDRGKTSYCALCQLEAIKGWNERLRQDVAGLQYALGMAEAAEDLLVDQLYEDDGQEEG